MVLLCLLLVGLALTPACGDDSASGPPGPPVVAGQGAAGPEEPEEEVEEDDADLPGPCPINATTGWALDAGTVAGACTVNRSGTDTPGLALALDSGTTKGCSTADWTTKRWADELIGSIEARRDLPECLGGFGTAGTIGGQNCEYSSDRRFDDEAAIVTVATTCDPNVPAASCTSTDPCAVVDQAAYIVVVKKDGYWGSFSRAFCHQLDRTSTDDGGDPSSSAAFMSCAAPDPVTGTQSDAWQSVSTGEEGVARRDLEVGLVASLLAANGIELSE